MEWEAILGCSSNSPADYSAQFYSNVTYDPSMEPNIHRVPFSQGATQMARDEASTSIGVPQTPPHGSPRNCLGLPKVIARGSCWPIQSIIYSMKLGIDPS